MPAARVTDLLTCVGPPDVIAKGSPTVLIGNLLAARMTDLTVHGGVIVVGCPTVIIGEVGAGSPISPGSGMGRVAAAMTNALKDTDAATSASGAATSASGKGVMTPQEVALLDAGDDGTPLVEKCPYAEH
jgi:hypothetical protein